MYIMPVLGFVFSKRKLIETTIHVITIKMNMVNTTFLYRLHGCCLEISAIFWQTRVKKIPKSLRDEFVCGRGWGCVFDFFSITLQYEFNKFE